MRSFGRSGVFLFMRTRTYSTLKMAFAVSAIAMSGCSQGDRDPGPTVGAAASSLSSAAEPQDVDLAIGPRDEVFRLSSTGLVWSYKKEKDSHSWVPLDKPMPATGNFVGEHVAVDPLGRPWLAGKRSSAGTPQTYPELWYRKGVNDWASVPAPTGCASIFDLAISGGMGDTYIICGASGTPYRWAHTAERPHPSPLASDWGAYPGSATRVAVVEGHEPYILTSTGQISRWDDDYNVWRNVNISNDYEKCLEHRDEFVGYANTRGASQTISPDRWQGAGSHRSFSPGPCLSCDCDPDSRKRDYCLACMAADDEPDYLCLPPHRAYPLVDLTAANCSTLPAPVLISFQAKLHVVLDPNKYEWFSLATITSDSTNSWNPVHVLNYEDYGPWTENGKGQLYLAHVPSTGLREHQYLGAKQFPLDRWVRVDMFIDYRPLRSGKGVIKVWQDGWLVASAAVAVPATGTVLKRAHFGFYGSATLGAGNEVLNDALRMQRVDNEGEAELLVRAPLVISSCGSTCR